MAAELAMGCPLELLLHARQLLDGQPNNIAHNLPWDLKRQTCARRRVDAPEAISERLRALPWSERSADLAQV